MRDKSSIDLSLIRCIRQLRMIRRIFLAALSLIAGVKLTKYLSLRSFDRRGRNVYPKKSNFSAG